MSPAYPDGVLLVDKPEGPTSHDVVARLRKRLGTRRVGHAGTLDPMATGLLVVLVGEATKLEPYLSSAEKAYLARVGFGRSTDTLDAVGQTTDEAELDPELLEELARLEAPSVGASAPRMEGALEVERARTEQIPPAHSAIHVDGVRSYALARAGRAVELPARPTRVLELRLTQASASPPFVDLSLRVSKGYYVRSLARDLGASLGVPSTLLTLRRTASLPFEVSAATELDASPEALRAALIPVAEAARRCLPSRELGADDVQRARCGQALSSLEGEASELPTAWLDADGQLVAIGRAGRVLRGFAPPVRVAPGSGER